LSGRAQGPPGRARRVGFERPTLPAEGAFGVCVNHPSICTNDDVGTDPPFIAMELLEGIRAFLTLWENADVELAILQQAREELENLR
jgi:hypothetical protein